MSRINKLALASLTFAVLGLAAAMPVRADTVVYSNNFSSPPTVTGVSATLTGGQAQTSPNGQQFLQLHSDAQNANLTIGGLQANSLVTLSFNLYGIQSLDGNSPNFGQDNFNLNANGTTLLFASFSNGNPATAAEGQTYGCPPGLSPCAPATGASAINTLVLCNVSF